MADKQHSLNNYLPQIQTDIKRRGILYAVFFLALIFSKEVFRINFSTYLFLIILAAFLATSFSLIVFRNFKNKQPQLTVDFYFFIIFLDIIFLTMIIYFLGCLFWIAPFFYSMLIINIFWFFPPNKAIFLVVWSVASLLCLISLEYFNLIPTFFPFPWDLWEENNIGNIYYVILTSIGSLAIIGLLGYSSDLSKQKLDKQILQIKKTGEDLKVAKEFLEIEIKNKTADLAVEKIKLEKEITERTRELEETKRTSRKRLSELENFHQEAVKRELEMIEIKDKIADNKKND